jgi:hypothetical protein
VPRTLRAACEEVLEDGEFRGRVGHMSDILWSQEAEQPAVSYVSSIARRGPCLSASRPRTTTAR